MKHDQKQEKREDTSAVITSSAASDRAFRYTIIDTKYKNGYAARILPGSERHYRFLTATTAQIFWTIKADGTVDDVPMWRAYTGQTQEEVKGHGWLKPVHRDDRKSLSLPNGNVPLRWQCF